MKGGTSMNYTIHGVYPVILLFFLKIFPAAFHQYSFVNKRLHYFQDARNIRGFHGTQPFIGVGENHGSHTQVGENLFQQNSRLPAVQNMGSADTFIAGLCCGFKSNMS